MSLIQASNYRYGKEPKVKQKKEKKKKEKVKVIKLSQQHIHEFLNQMSEHDTVVDIHWCACVLYVSGINVYDLITKQYFSINGHTIATYRQTYPSIFSIRLLEYVIKYIRLFVTKHVKTIVHEEKIVDPKKIISKEKQVCRNVIDKRRLKCVRQHMPVTKKSQEELYQEILFHTYEYGNKDDFISRLHFQPRFNPTLNFECQYMIDGFDWSYHIASIRTLIAEIDPTVMSRQELLDYPY